MWRVVGEWVGALAVFVVPALWVLAVEALVGG